MKPKKLTFTIESEAKPDEIDGKAVMRMETKVHADIKEASTEQLAALLAYLGEEAITKTMHEFSDRDDKPQIQECVEAYHAKREEMMSNLRTALAKAMLKEMMEAMMMAMKEKEGDKPATTKAEEPLKESDKEADGDDAPASGGDTTIVIVKK